MSRSKGKSICLFSAKGGVGKTITCINLAGIYEHLEKKVLLVDLDLSSGGLSMGLTISIYYHVQKILDKQEK